LIPSGIEVLHRAGTLPDSHRTANPASSRVHFEAA
jgi:hypothetical protein